MKHIEKIFDFLMRNILEPSLQWVIDHPIVTVAAVVALIYWAVRGYRTI